MQSNIKTLDIPASESLGMEFWLWLAGALLTFALVIVFATAWLVRHAMRPPHSRMTDAQAEMVIAVAQFPRLVIDTFQSLSPSRDPIPLLLNRKATERANWVRRFPAPEDSGYLLFSGVDSVEKKSLVQLIRIADGHVMAQWNPDWLAINSKMSSKKYANKGSTNNFRAMHPLLLENGDVIFNTQMSLVRLSTCSTQPIFVLDQIMHHSIDLDENGNAIWGSSVVQDGLIENSYLNKTIRDDSLAHVTTDGKLLENRSFSRILIDNDLKAMLLGRFGHGSNPDPIHLNQITVAKHNSHFWLRGDLLISARHLSTLFLYRPSTNKIVWYKTGPWMNQHSVDFVDDHRISVFNNNVVTTAPKGQEFLTPGDTNNVMVYDFETKQVTEPFANLVTASQPLSITEGRARLLPDGGLFLEETNNGRQLRFTANRLLWSRINDYDANRIGMVSWSSYLTAGEASTALRRINEPHCR